MKNWFQEKLDNPKSFISKAWRFISLFDERLERHHTFMQASGIAFNIILYLLPMFLIAVLIVRLILGEQAIIEVIHNLLLDFLPPTEGTYSLLETITHEIELLVQYSGVFGVIGIFVLLWLSSTLISSFRTALNSIFNISSPHVFLLYRFKDMLLIIVLTILILIYSYAIPIVTFISSWFGGFISEGATEFINQIVFYLLSLVTSFALLYFIYRFVPNKKIPRRPRIMATILAVALIEISRHLFGWYVSSISNYGKFYGIYAVFVSGAIWIYYSSLIILLSAELSKFLYDTKWQKEELEKSQKKEVEDE